MSDFKFNIGDKVVHRVNENDKYSKQALLINALHTIQYENGEAIKYEVIGLANEGGKCGGLCSGFELSPYEPKEEL